MKDKIRWGILGTGRIAHTLARTIGGSADGVLYAAASRDISRAKSFADEFGAEKAYGSYEDLAADDNVDVVYIATPMSSHYKDSLLCLNSGRHVLCEKTVTLNCSELREILDLAYEKKLFFMEGMWMKCRPAYRRAKEWADSGRIGELTNVRADFRNYVPYDENDRLFRADCGGGALLDLGVYTLTFAMDFLGYSPEKVASHLRMGEGGVDHFDHIVLGYDGKTADITSGFDIALPNNAVVYGSEGRIEFGNWFLCCSGVSLFDRNGETADTFVRENSVNGYEYEIDEVHRCLREGLTESPLVPHSETYVVLRVMDECRRSAGFVYPGEQCE